jgi:hypothetical protein
MRRRVAAGLSINMPWWATPANSKYKGLEAAIKQRNYAWALEEARTVPRVGLSEALALTLFAAEHDPRPNGVEPSRPVRDIRPST